MDTEMDFSIEGFSLAEKSYLSKAKSIDSIELDIESIQINNISHLRSKCQESDKKVEFLQKMMKAMKS